MNTNIKFIAIVLASLFLIANSASLDETEIVSLEVDQEVPSIVALGDDSKYDILEIPNQAEVLDQEGTDWDNEVEGEDDGDYIIVDSDLDDEDDYEEWEDVMPDEDEYQVEEYSEDYI